MKKIGLFASLFVISLLLASIVMATGSSSGSSSVSSAKQSIAEIAKYLTILKKLNECSTESDCYGKGKCMAGGAILECTCYRGKCFPGLIEQKSADETIEAELKKLLTCEDKPTLPARIACRLKNKNLTEASIPESCRVLDSTNKGKCILYYAKIQHCYNETGVEKDKCFKRVAGIVGKKIKEVKEEFKKNKQAHKDYLLALLYDLQEKVEKQVEKERLTAEEGAEIIAKITEIKTSVSEGKAKKDIKAGIEYLKKLWKERIKNEN